jgi:hypothetical protein
MKDEKMKHKCKINVLCREFYPDLADEYLADPNVGKCNLFEDGVESVRLPFIPVNARRIGAGPYGIPNPESEGS